MIVAIVKSIGRCTISVIVAPACDYRIEHPYQRFLLAHFMPFNDVTDFRPKAFLCIFRRGCVQLLSELSYIETQKIKSVIDKNAPESLRESILVLDANTGQNGLSQAQVFTECVNLTCVALTKLDGSAKGGIILSIAKEMKLPVKLIGVGEKIDDLKDFDSQEFVKALFS